MKNRTAFASVLFLVTTGSAQPIHPANTPGKTVAKVPSGCPAAPLSSLAELSGTEAFKAVRYQLAALSMAQEADGKLNQALQQVDTPDAHARSMAQALHEAEAATAQMGCAAYIIGRWTPVNKDDEGAAAALVSAYSRKAGAMNTVVQLTRAQYESSNREQDPSSISQDATHFAAVAAEQKKASSEILDATVSTVLRMVDLTDKSGPDTPFLAIPCSERDDLLSRTASLGGDQGSEYVKTWNFIHEFLSGRRCHPASSQTTGTLSEASANAPSSRHG